MNRTTTSIVAGAVVVAAVIGAIVAPVLLGIWNVMLAIFSDLGVEPHTWRAALVGALVAITLRFDQLRGTAARNHRHMRAAAIGGVAAAVWLALTGPRPFGPAVVGAVPVWVSTALVIERIFGSMPTPRRLAGELMYASLEALRAGGLLFFITIVLFPFYFMVASSLKARAELLQHPTNLAIDLTQGLDRLLVGYRDVLVRFQFGRYVFNSTFIALFTVVLTLIPAILGAYAVTRLHFRGRDLLSRSILLIYMFPAIVLVIPLYSVFSQLGLRDTLPGLMVVYPAMTIPVALYMLRSYFLTLPKDIEEAGLIDGCTRFEVIWRITLPLSLPALASVGLYVFMIAWNEFLFAFMFLDTPEIFTLSRGMVALNTQEVPRQFLMAGAVIITVPIMVLFFWFERFLVGGLAAGGVKG